MAVKDGEGNLPFVLGENDNESRRQDFGTSAESGKSRNGGNRLFYAGKRLESGKKDCGTSEFDGVMVHEMLDAAGKKAVRSGTKELEYNGFKFKLVR